MNREEPWIANCLPADLLELRIAFGLDLYQNIALFEISQLLTLLKNRIGRINQAFIKILDNLFSDWFNSEYIFNTVLKIKDKLNFLY